MSTEKPHKGLIENWWKYDCGCGDKETGLGYLIRGQFVNHPYFGNAPNSHTSYVVKHEGNEIETRNSRYALGKERGVPAALKTPVFELTYDRFDYKAGTRVYPYSGYDYGLCRDDEAATGIYHIAMTLEENGKQFFTVPLTGIKAIKTII